MAFPAPSVIGPDVTGATPGALKARVTVPPEPLSVSVEKVAVPAALVVAEVPPLNVAVPEAIEAVTTAPDWPTALPEPSRSCSTGWGESGTPLPAVPGGAVVKSSWLAGPATLAKVKLVAGASPADVTVRVYPAPTRSSERFEKVAIPLTAATVVVPVSVAPPGLVLSAIDTELAAAVTVPP